MATLTFSPAFDNYAFQDTDLTTGTEWTLASASSVSLIAGYVLTLADPNKVDYYYRPGLDFTVGAGAFPVGSTITAVSLRLNVTFQDGSTGSFNIAKKLSGGTFAGEADPQTFWTEADGGTLYATWSPSSAPPPNLYTITLNAAAVTDMQTLLTFPGTFTTGIAETGPLDVTSLRRFIDSQQGATAGNRPLLTVTYTPPASTRFDLNQSGTVRFPRVRGGGEGGGRSRVSGG